MTLHEDHSRSDIGVVFQGGSLSLKAMSVLGMCRAIQHKSRLLEGAPFTDLTLDKDPERAWSDLCELHNEVLKSAKANVELHMSLGTADSLETPFQRTLAGAQFERQAISEVLTLDEKRDKPRMDHDRLLDPSRFGSVVSHHDIWSDNPDMLSLEYQRYDPMVWRRGMSASLEGLPTLHAIGIRAGLGESILSPDDCVQSYTAAELVDKWSTDLFPMSTVPSCSNLPPFQSTSGETACTIGPIQSSSEEQHYLVGVECHVERSLPVVKEESTVDQEHINPYTGFFVAC